MYLYPFTSSKTLLSSGSSYGMKERQSSEFAVTENRKQTGTSVICETFIPHDWHIYFYVPGSTSSNDVEKEHAKKRKRNEETRHERTSHTGAPIIRRILDYLFISPRFARTRRYSTCSQNLVSLVDEKRSKKYFRIEEAEECRFTDYFFLQKLAKRSTQRCTLLK